LLQCVSAASAWAVTVVAVLPFAMNAIAPSEARTVSLVDIIDFKWLMAGRGHGVHVERMQSDPAYARQCLLCGALSATPTLCETARRLARSMGIELPAA
jgi:hypothetical protein